MKPTTPADQLAAREVLLESLFATIQLKPGELPDRQAYGVTPPPALACSVAALLPAIQRHLDASYADCRRLAVGLDPVEGASPLLVVAQGAASALLGQAKVWDFLSGIAFAQSMRAN